MAEELQLDHETAPEVLHELRRTRRRNRVAELEWFEVAYRVYLVALGGGGLVLWLSAAVQDDLLNADGVADVRSHLPALVGLVAALAVFLGLRSGARGGPLAIEEAEVRIVLLAPVDRASALRRPAYQRIRTLLFVGTVVGAVAAQLLGRRIDGSVGAWVVSGAVAGGTLALAFSGAALVAHGVHLPQWQATAIGGALLVVQAAALAGTLPAGPFDTVGGIVLWPDQVSLVDVVAPLAAVALNVAGFALLGRFSLEQLVRRSALVAQLRFAVTLQDVRTVTLLRRQLSLEHARHRPWFTFPGRGPASWRRSWASVARFPGRRLVRMLLLTGGCAGTAVAAHRGTTPAIIPAGLMAFLLGLEALEPLAQELDHPERTDALPVPAGRLHQHLTIVPAIVLLVFGFVGAAIAVLVEQSADGITVAALLGPTIALAGGAGAALNTIAGAPDPFTSEISGAMLPPEVAGITMTLRLLWPPLVAVAGVIPVLLAREANERGDDQLAAAVRGAIGVLVVVVLVAMWVERRPQFKIWWQNLKLDASGRQTIQRSTGGAA
ncbi:MAG: DUF6297 family protein [Acidimicrobiia bacterium]